MSHTNRIARWTAVAATATMLMLSSAPSAAARPWPGDPQPQLPDALTRHDQLCASQLDATVANMKVRVWTDANCPLRRVGSQFVRCDNLTGAGVAAPSWVPAQ
jgi:hypothetical protein